MIAKMIVNMDALPQRGTAFPFDKVGPIDVNKELAHGANVKIMRDLWIADGRPEYEFWSIMMATYTGLWPAAAINEKAA